MASLPYGLAVELLSHTEPCAAYGFDRRGGPSHLDLCRVPPAEEVEQQLARSSGDAGNGLPSLGPYGLVGSRPLKLETRAAQPPREEPARLADAAPEGLVHLLVV